MTKRKVSPPSSAATLADLITVVTAANADAGMKAQAIQIAYEVGRCEGRLEGAISMGDRLVKPNHE
jgi:hypothetical protein